MTPFLRRGIADTNLYRPRVIHTDGDITSISSPVTNGQHSSSPSLLHLILDVIQSADQVEIELQVETETLCCLDETHPV